MILAVTNTTLLSNFAHTRDQIYHPWPFRASPCRQLSGKSSIKDVAPTLIAFPRGADLWFFRISLRKLTRQTRYLAP
jgi:hypothetical protein